MYIPPCAEDSARYNSGQRALATAPCAAETRGTVCIEIVNTGSELMLGRVLNTHQQWLCRQLAERGYLVRRQTAVPDSAAEIQAALRESLGRADVVITTGGLGPTTDDLTRNAIADLLGVELVEDTGVRTHIERWFAARNRVAPPSTRAQAQVPSGALVLPNANGTAPGLILQTPGPTGARGTASGWIVMLPGPPRELRPMFTAQVLPWLEQTVPPPERYRCRTLRTTGIGESILEERVAPVLAPLVRVGLGLGYCARPGEVDVLLRMRGDQAETVLAEAAVIVHQTVAGYVFGEGEEPLEEVVVRLLAARGQTLVTAESCTGGRLANRITDVPGASAVFLGGAVTYSNALKQTVLGVRAETLAAHGAVSEPTAREMAEGARQRFGAEYALATTGIAGPSGGSEAKPVGTVFIALATAGRTVVARQLNRFERDTFKHVSAQQALEMLRRELAQR